MSGNVKGKKLQVFSTKKRKTYLRMLKSIIIAVVMIIIVLIVLQALGINVSSMLAGVGIASIVIGFALQDAMKDIFRGLEIVADNYYDIGDLIKFGDNLGQVISINLRTTKIQDINTMNIVSIANRNIDKVEVDPGYIYIPIPFSYDVKVEVAESVIQEMLKKLRRHTGITSADYQGIAQIDTSSLNYQIVITCDPASRLQIRRDALRIIMTTLEEHKLRIPYTQLDLHTKK